MSSWSRDEKPLQVWRVVFNIPEIQGQAEIFVGVKSRAAAARAFGCSDMELKTYGAETGNHIQIALAYSSPGTVFYRKANDHNGVFIGRGLSEAKMQEATNSASHADELQKTRDAGKEYWRTWDFGDGATLKIGALSATIEHTSEGYKVVFAERTLKNRYQVRADAKVAAVAFARQELTRVLAALPDNPTLENGK